MLLGQLRSATAGQVQRSRSQAAGAVACCAPPLAAPTSIAESRRTQQVVRSEPFFLKQPRLLPSSHQHLIIPKEGVSQLFPHRIPTKSLIPGRSLARWWSQDPQANRTAYSSFQVVLAFELDGQIMQRKTLVDLRFYPGRHNVRVHNHQAFDLLKGRKLLGWRRDSASQLVAILSSPAGAPPVPAGPPPTPIRIPRSLRRTQQPHKASQLPGTDLRASVDHWITGLPYADPPPFKEILSLPSPAGMAAAVPAASRGTFSKTPLSIEQQLVQQAAGAPWPHFMQQYVPPLQPTQQQELPPGRPAPASSPTASSPPAARDRKRTFVPARLRPVMSEVYVPFGLWRDLFDGSDRPFPDKGLALRIAITGVVQMADQPALLVRRVTPYGYYVLRGLKGLASLKGKLMVRWSLLVNGVVELEIGAPESKAPTPALVPVAAGSVRPGGSSGNIVPMAPGMRRLQSNAPHSHSLYM